MSDDWQNDIYKALVKGESAFLKSLEKDMWDLDIRYSFEAMVMDGEGRIVKRMFLGNKR